MHLTIKISCEEFTLFSKVHVDHQRRGLHTVRTSPQALLPLALGLALVAQTQAVELTAIVWIRRSNLTKSAFHLGCVAVGVAVVVVVVEAATRCHHYHSLCPTTREHFGT